MLQSSSEFMAIVEFQILPKWFDLDTRTQRDYVQQLGSVMSRYDRVKCRWFDADAWTTDLTDFVICEFEDLNEYNELWSELRRHPFLATPYATITHVLMGMELQTDGLARIADEPEFQREKEGPVKPSSIAKPIKPNRAPKLRKPPKTGKPLKSNATEEQEFKACHFCGHLLKKSARFCSRCGTPTS